MISLRKLNKLLMALLIVLNIFGAAVQAHTGVSRQLFVAAAAAGIMGIYVLVSFINDELRLKPWFLAVLGIELFTIVLHIALFGDVSNELSMMLYFAIFLFVGLTAKKGDFDFVLKVVNAISIFMCGQAIYYFLYVIAHGWNTYNVRLFTTAPKEDYTFILAISFSFSLFELLFNTFCKKKALFLCGVMFLDCFVNVVVMQSKTMILIIMALVAVAFFFCDRKMKKYIIAVLCAGLAVLVFIFIFYSELVPEYVFVFINKVTGLMGDKLARSSKIYEGTYDQRSVIYAFSLDLFMHNFVSGVGFSRFAEYSSASSDAYVNAVVQTESGVVSAFVEGGIAFGAMYMCLILVPGAASAYYSIKRDNPNCVKTVLMSLTIFLLALNNDTASITFWVLLSLHFSQMFFDIGDNGDMIRVKNHVRKRLGV